MAEERRQTNWTRLSTAALETLLALDLEADGTDQLSPEDIYAITAELDRRDPLSVTDPDTAWAALRERLTEPVPEPLPTEEAPSLVRHLRGRAKRLQWVLAAVLVVCIVAIPVGASGKTDGMAQWSDDTFSFSSVDPEYHQDNQFMYDSVAQETEKITDLPVVPKWYPEYCELDRMHCNSDPFPPSVKVEINHRGMLLSMDFIVIENMEGFRSEYEKNPGPVEKYEAGGISHYIMGNYDLNLVVWRNENVECSISGYLSVEELKAMVDSIYE